MWYISLPVGGDELYETWLKNSQDLSQDIGHAQALIDSAISSHCKLHQVVSR